MFVAQRNECSLKVVSKGVVFQGQKSSVYKRSCRFSRPRVLIPKLTIKLNFFFFFFNLVISLSIPLKEKNITISSSLYSGDEHFHRLPPHQNARCGKALQFAPSALGSTVA